MEQRWSGRTTAGLEVDLIWQEEAIRCRTRDIGLGGLYLEGPSQQLPLPGARVELHFRLRREMECHRFSAQVVRVGEGGIGLMFCALDAAGFRALQEIIHYTGIYADAAPAP